MNFPTFHIPKGVKEWLMALFWASVSGGINSVIESYGLGSEADLFSDAGQKMLLRKFIFGFVGGLVLYLKVFVRGASKQAEEEIQAEKAVDGGDLPANKE